MIYGFVKISNKWYCKTLAGVYSESQWIQEHVDEGNIVALGDDIEWFCHEMGVNEDDIITIEEDD